jgi:hypothetical protein
MNSADIVHWVGVVAAAGALFLYSAYHRPQVYLRWRDAITWSIHALALGFIFGIGVIIGRYGVYGDAIKPAWMVLHLSLVTGLYIAALAYHRFVCTIAEDVAASFAQQRSRN